MKIWIDDIRPAPAAGWVWVKSSTEAIGYLATCKGSGFNLDIISFDHDLGGDDTSRRVALWLCEMDYWPTECRVHSANPVGVEWLRGIITTYGVNKGLTRLV